MNQFNRCPCRGKRRETFLAIAGRKYTNDVQLDGLLAAIENVPLAVMLLAHAGEAELDLTGVWQRWQQERTEMLRRAGGSESLTNIEVSYEISIKGPRMTAEARRLLALVAHLPDGGSKKPQEIRKQESIELQQFWLADAGTLYVHT